MSPGTDKQTVWIAGAARTPIGNFQGGLAQTPVVALGSHSIHASVARAAIPQAQIEGVYMGCVLSAGQGQAPARQAALGAGLPESAEAVTISKVCGSGMKAIMVAHDTIRAGAAQVLVAGGMESMSRAPYLLEKARAGYRLGHGVLADHLFVDGLEDAYQKGTLMGLFAEATAARYGFTREMQDAFAAASVAKAQEATAKGYFHAEIAPITVKQGKTTQEITADEGVGTAQPDKIPHLRPAFKPDGTITAANASSISDGAASLILVADPVASGLPIEARVIAHATHAQSPEWFTTAPIGAVQKVLQKARLRIEDIDLFEINEAFAVVTLAAIQDLKLPPDRVNIHGGACVLGHPIGASGARVVVTLLHALKTHGLRRGLAAVCIGGGEATAMIIERV